MDTLLELLYSKWYRWLYLSIYTITTAVSIILSHISENSIQAIVSIVTSVVDWAGVLGFVIRKPFLYFQFWQGWLFWSIIWYLYNDGMTMFQGFQFYDPIGLAISTAIIAYYLSFFMMIYCYSFVDKKLWLHGVD